MASKRKIKSDGLTPKAILSMTPDNFGALGKRIEIGARTKVSVNKSGAEIKFNVPTVDVVIGIGNNHVALLIMDVEAWKALKADEKIDITTITDFKKNFL